MDFNFIFLFIESIPLQFDFFGGERGALGSDDPIVKGLDSLLVCSCWIWNSLKRV